jgi:hypothetical protein
MGFCYHPQSHDIQFAHYNRVLCIAQTNEAALVEKERQAAAIL